MAGEAEEVGVQSLSWDCKAWMWERVESEEGERQRGQVHVKWKPDCRCCCRSDVGSSGEVSACVRAIASSRRGRLQDMVISSPVAIGRVTRTVCVKKLVSITYCALLPPRQHALRFSPLRLPLMNLRERNNILRITSMIQPRRLGPNR